MQTMRRRKKEKEFRPALRIETMTRSAFAPMLEP